MKNYQKRGWVRLYRQIEDNPLYFLEPFTKAQAWIDMFLNANHKDSMIQIRNNVIRIKRGQLGWSEITMCKRWKWSKGKVRNFLKLLKTEQQIIQQQHLYMTTVITILNYDNFQNDTAERQQTDSRQYSRQYINNNDKNVKNVNKAFSFEKRKGLNLDPNQSYSPKGLPSIVKEILRAEATAKAEGVKHVSTLLKGAL